MKAYETKKKLALSLAVAMVASSAPVLAFADTAIVAQAEAEMTVEEIIASVSAAINDPFLAAGLARIEAGEAAVATLPDGATKTALTETLQTARHMYDGLEQINQIWVALGAAGWQTNYKTEVAELQAIIAQLDAAFPGGSAFLNNFKTAVTETGLTYAAFVAIDVADVNPTAANIAAAKEAVSKIMNPVAKANAQLRIETEIENQGLAVVSVSAINSTQVEIKFNQAVSTKSGVNGLSNFYFSLTDDVVIGSDLATLNATGYTAEFSKDGKSVIISADYSAGKVIWKDNNSSALDAIVIKGTDTVVENKTVYVQARDLVLADGKLASTVEGSFIAKDTARPEISKITSTYDGTDTDVTVLFNEPVVDTDVEFYFDSNKISGATLDADGITLEFTLASEKLSDGEYEFEAVGVQDLAGNAALGDVLTKTLVVESEEDETIIPEVVSIQQIHDGAFNVMFNTDLTSANVTIKNLQNNTDEIYALGSGTAVVEDGKTIGYNFTVQFADATASGQVYDFEDVYKTSKEISRTIVIDDIVSSKGVKGQKSTSIEKFIIDQLAPVVVDSEHAGNGVFNIEFNDAPFNGTMKLNSGDVIVKLVVDGETKSAAVTPTFAAGVLKVTLLDGVGNHPQFFKDGKILNGDYKFELPRGLVEDAKADSTPQYEGPFASVATTVDIEVTSGVAASVPQTAKGLVEYVAAEKAIYVFFVGEDIDATTATKASNYSIAGNTLTNKSTLEYTSSDDLGVDFTGTTLTLPNVKGGLVKIFLEENTIKRDGSYTLNVKDVATKSGAKMLPTSVTVADLVDNTQPELLSAKVTGDAQIELTFDESVDLDNASAAVRNFVVKVGSAEYSIDTVAKKVGNDKVLVIHTKDNKLNTSGTVTVELVRDQNNDMFVIDDGGNEAAEVTVTATK